MTSSRVRSRSVQRVEGARFNADRTRYCFRTPRGIACYRGSANERGEWVGRIAGVVATDDEATRFLDGAIVTFLPPA